MANSGPNGEWLATTPEFWAGIERPVIAFQIWYADGSFVIGYSPFDWDCFACTDVQVVMLHHPEGARHIIAGKDEYTFPGAATSKLGLEIELAVFNTIQANAVSDEWRPPWALTT